MQMRLPHVWGGEPELLMSSHVLQYVLVQILYCFNFLPDIRFIHGFKVCPGLFCRVSITVHMFDNKTDCLKVIAEYGQEYGKDNPIRVLYHGYGHYDALRSSSRSLLSKK